MKYIWPLTLGISGPSKSGKTTLIESILPSLVASSLRIVVLKKHGHPVDLDTPGKDSDRFYHAKSDAILHDEKQILYRFQEKNTLEQTLRLVPGYYDLILVEGNKQALIPKIWLEKNCPLSSEHSVLASLDREEQTIERVLPLLFGWIEKAWKNLPLGIAFVCKGKQISPSLSANFVLAERLARQIVIVADTSFSYQNALVLPFIPNLSFPLCAIFPLFLYFPEYRWLVFYEDKPWKEKEIEIFLSQIKIGEWFLEEKGTGLYYPQIYHLWEKILCDFPEEAKKECWVNKIPGFLGKNALYKEKK